MNVIKTNLDVEVTIHFEDDGRLIVEVFHGKDEDPVANVTLSLFKLVKEYVDCVSNPNTQLIDDCDAVEMAYNIIDELQDSIDYLNDCIEDPDDSTD